MERRQIGVVQELFRYPVKSMLGERPSAVDIGAHGVIGDRAYALREANGRIVTAKKWANMFEFGARYDAPPTPGALGPTQYHPARWPDHACAGPRRLCGAVRSTGAHGGARTCPERPAPPRGDRSCHSLWRCAGGARDCQDVQRQRCLILSRCHLARSSTRPAFTCWQVAHSPTCAC